MNLVPDGVMTQIDLNYAEMQNWKSNFLMEMQSATIGISYMMVQQVLDETASVLRSPY